MEKQYSKAKIDKMTKQLSSLKDKSEKAQYKLGEQATHLQDLINKLKNNSQDKQHQLADENKMNQIKYLYHEYLVAIKFLKSNSSNIDSTILVFVYKKLMKATPQWLPSSCKMTSFKEDNKYIQLLIDNRHNKKPQLVFEKRNLPSNCRKEIMNMPFNKLKKLIKANNKFYGLRVAMLCILLFPIFIFGAIGIVSSSLLCFVLTILSGGAFFLVAPKKLAVALNSVSYSEKYASLDNFNYILANKADALEKYKKHMKKSIQNKQTKNTTTTQHIKNIKHEGTTWDSIEKHTA